MSSQVSPAYREEIVLRRRAKELKRKNLKMSSVFIPAEETVELRDVEDDETSPESSQSCAIEDILILAIILLLYLSIIVIIFMANVSHYYDDASVAGDSATVNM